MKLPALLIAGFVAAGVALFCIVAGFVFAGLRRANLAWAASLLAWFFLAAAAAQIERMAVPANQITNLAGDGRLDLVSRCAGAEFCAPILCGCPGDFVTTSISRKSSRRANGKPCSVACGRLILSTNAHLEFRRLIAQASGWKFSFGRA
jgi:hypothetical protein